MADHYILDNNGQPVPVDVLVWSLWYENAASRVLAQTDTTEGFVSTVFLGLDHSFGSGPPVLWESLVFGGARDGWMDRYTSREDALLGHRFMVEELRNPANILRGYLARLREWAEDGFWHKLWQSIRYSLIELQIVRGLGVERSTCAMRAMGAGRLHLIDHRAALDEMNSEFHSVLRRINDDNQG